MNGKKERNYGIDLLRLISMFMVVMLHVLGNTNILQNTIPFTIAGELTWSIEIICFCAVNVYAIISGYVGLNSQHKYSNLITLALQIIFYSIFFTLIELIICLINNTAINFSNIITFLLPTIQNYWYFSAYFCLFFFIPVLKYVIQKVPKNTLKISFIFILLIFCFYTQLQTKTSGLLRGYSFLWLAILYVIGGYMAKYNPLKKVSPSKSIICYLCCVLLTILSKLLFTFAYKQFPMIPNIANLLISYTSPTILFSAIFLVNAFSKIKLKHIKIIKVFAPLSFGVYAIHCHPYIRSLIFYEQIDFYKSLFNSQIYISIPCLILIALEIFIGCLLIDYLRSILFKVCKIKQFSCWLEKIISKFFKSLLKIFKINFDEPIKCNTEDQVSNNDCINVLENNIENSDNASETDIKKD